MIRAVPVFRVLGGLLIGLGLMMTPSLIADAAAPGQGGAPFLVGAAAAVIAGLTLLLLSASDEAFELSRRQAFLITGLAWLVLPAFAGVPFLFLGLSPAGAYFEAASGLTTTGATVISGLDSQSSGILLWRSMLQMVGGLGIIVLGILVMPFLRVGGMQLFRTESSDQSEKIFAKGLDLARWIAGVFIGLILVCAVVYAALGMSAFDAINHAMSTISTGGFSTHDASFAYFASPALEWAGAFFMLIGGLPFVALIRTVRGRRDALFTDVQARGFILFLFVATAFVGVTHSVTNAVLIEDALRLAAFNVISVVTTTGFASADYQAWGPFAFGAFFLLTFVGGCSGSTAGGIKIYRLQILWKLARAHLTRIVSPSHVVVLSYSTRRIDDETAFAILTFLVAMLATLAVFTLALSLIGLDFVTSLTSALTCITNVGPGLGPIVGPAGNFAPLPDAAKAVLSLAMILGRLEFFTLLVMLTPAFWRG